MPRRHRHLSDMMAELEATVQPPVANYVFLNAYFFLEAQPDSNISTDFTIARFRRRASISMDNSIVVKFKEINLKFEKVENV